MNKLLIFILLFVSALPVISQEHKEMNARDIYVTFDKIKHIVLPSQVSDISFGREDFIYAERVDQAPNIVRLTAQEESFVGTTNLIITCTDGSVHTFRVSYLPDGFKDVDHIIYADAGKYQRSTYNVIVNCNYETTMFFPEDIIYCKQGNEALFGVEYYNNKLKVYTNTDSFSQSNLFVVDKDLNTYEITLNEGLASSYTYNFDNGRKYTAHIDVNSVEMTNHISRIRIKKRNIFSVGVIKNKFEMSMANLYVHKDFMFFAFDIKNFSNIDYDIDFIKCFQRDMKKSKNTIQQELEITPVYQRDFTRKISGNTTNRFILVFNKFTIPDDKIFEIEMFEKGGGRHMTLTILNEYILSAENLY